MTRRFRFSAVMAGVLTFASCGCEPVASLTGEPPAQQPAPPVAARAPSPSSSERPKRDRSAEEAIERRDDAIGVVRNVAGSVPGQRNDAMLLSLADVPAELFTLRELVLSGSPVTSAGLKHVARMTLIESLDISQLTFTEEVLVGLLELPKLRRLTMRRAHFPEAAGLKIIGQMKQLEALTLAETGVTDADLLGLQNMPALRELHLDETKLTDEAFEHLATLPQLEVLTLSKTAISARGLQKLCGTPVGSRLLVLDVHRTSAGRNGFTQLSCLTALEDLDASFAQVTDDSLRGWKSPPHLRKLNLANNGFTSLSLPGILAAPDLEELNLQKVAGIDDPGLNHIVKKTGLRFVQLDQTGVSLPSAQELKRRMPATRVGIAGTIY